MKKLILLLFSCVAMYNPDSHAGGFKIAMQGLKQIGMGSTGVGYAQDGATMYFNPAGLCFVNSQVNAGMSGLFPTTTFLEKGTNTLTNSVNHMFTPFSLYAHADLTKSVKFGIGIYTPFGTGITYPTAWSGRYILHKIELQTVFIQPTLSFKLSKNFSLGGGFIYSTGNVLLEKDLPIISGQENATASARLKGNGDGFGFNLGAYLKASERLHLGVAYHSQVNMKVDDGEAIFSNIPVALVNTSFPLSTSFKTELALPSEIAAGLSYKLTNDFVVAVDFNHTFWKSFDSLGFDYTVNTSSVTDKKSPRLYENASCIRIGAQLKAGKNWDIRAGLFFDQTPVKDGYVAPELPDNNKVGLTAGATIRIYERLHIDLSLLFEDVSEREQRNKETGFEGTYQTRVVAPGIGVTYLFQKKTAKRKTF